MPFTISIGPPFFEGMNFYLYVGGFLFSYYVYLQSSGLIPYIPHLYTFYYSSIAFSIFSWVIASFAMRRYFQSWKNYLFVGLLPLLFAWIGLFYYFREYILLPIERIHDCSLSLLLINGFPIYSCNCICTSSHSSSSSLNSSAVAVPPPTCYIFQFDCIKDPPIDHMSNIFDALVLGISLHWIIMCLALIGITKKTSIYRDALRSGTTSTTNATNSNFQYSPLATNIDHQELLEGDNLTRTRGLVSDVEWNQQQHIELIAINHLSSSAVIHDADASVTAIAVPAESVEEQETQNHLYLPQQEPRIVIPQDIKTI